MYSTPKFLKFLYSFSLILASFSCFVVFVLLPIQCLAVGDEIKQTGDGVFVTGIENSSLEKISYKFNGFAKIKKHGSSKNTFLIGALENELGMFRLLDPGASKTLLKNLHVGGLKTGCVLKDTLDVNNEVLIKLPSINRLAFHVKTMATITPKAKLSLKMLVGGSNGSQWIEIKDVLAKTVTIDGPGKARNWKWKTFGSSVKNRLGFSIGDDWLVSMFNEEYVFQTQILQKRDKVNYMSFIVANGWSISKISARVKGMVLNESVKQLHSFKKTTLPNGDIKYQGYIGKLLGTGPTDVNDVIIYASPKNDSADGEIFKWIETKRGNRLVKALAPIKQFKWGAVNDFSSVGDSIEVSKLRKSENWDTFGVNLNLDDFKIFDRKLAIQKIEIEANYIEVEECGEAQVFSISNFSLGADSKFYYPLSIIKSIHQNVMGTVGHEIFPAPNKLAVPPTRLADIRLSNKIISDDEIIEDIATKGAELGGRKSYFSTLPYNSQVSRTVQFRSYDNQIRFFRGPEHIFQQIKTLETSPHFASKLPPLTADFSTAHSRLIVLKWPISLAGRHGVRIFDYQSNEYLAGLATGLNATVYKLEEEAKYQLRIDANGFALPREIFENEFLKIEMISFGGVRFESSGSDAFWTENEVRYHPIVDSKLEQTFVIPGQNNRINSEENEVLASVGVLSENASLSDFEYTVELHERMEDLHSIGLVYKRPADGSHLLGPNSKIKLLFEGEKYTLPNTNTVSIDVTKHLRERINSKDKIGKISWHLQSDEISYLKSGVMSLGKWHLIVKKYEKTSINELVKKKLREHILGHGVPIEKFDVDIDWNNEIIKFSGSTIEKWFPEQVLGKKFTENDYFDSVVLAAYPTLTNAYAIQY